jgi:predicted RNA-binding protein with TRAM domain
MAYTNRRSSFRRESFKPAPVELGKEYEAEITEMSRRGDAGVAKIQGFVVFVSDAKVGEHTKFVITKVGRRYATAELVKAKAEDDEEQEAE